MSISNIINPITKKIYFELIPAGPPALVPNLEQVLISGNSAGTPSNPQTIENLDSLETQKIYQGNYLNLQIGESGDTLQIKGATALGSILVGNSVNTEELIAGANGLVLTTNSSAPLGVEWAIGGGGSGVASVSAGLNVDITGTGANPIVGLKAPLTTTLNMGAVAITDSASATGTAGQYLTAGTGASTLWATLPTSVASVSAGLNIGITGTSTAPVVGLLAPLTSTLNVGSQSITSTTGAITITPLATTDLNQVISGAGKVHTTQSTIGGPTQPAYQIENTNANANAVHIDLYKNSASPAVNDGIGGISFHAKNSAGTSIEYARIQADQRSIVSPNESGSLSLSVNQGGAGLQEYLRINATSGNNELYRDLDTRGQTIKTSTAQLLLANPTNNGITSITNTGTNSNISLSASVGISTVGITSSGATTIQANGGISLNGVFSGIYTNQPVGGSRSALRSGIGTYPSSNVDYYPSLNVGNSNGNSFSVPLPLMPYQNMTIINEGITPTISWNDYGAPQGNFDCLYRDPSTSNYWIATGNSIIVMDPILSTVLQSNLFITGTSSGSSGGKVNCFFYSSGYMFIGGDFTTVIDVSGPNAQPQYGLSRINISTYGVGNYLFEPIFDTVNNSFGIHGYVNAITEGVGYMFVGGNFYSYAPMGNPNNFIFEVSNYTSYSGGQIYDNGIIIPNILSVNGEVNCLAFYSNYLYVGGGYSQVDTINGALGYQYFSVYEVNVGWNYTAGGAGVFNNTVYSCAQSNLGGYIFVAGAFSSPYQYNCYIEGATPTNLAIDSQLGSNPVSNINNIYCGGGVDLLVDSSTYAYQSTSLTNWTYLGQSGGLSIPTGISTNGTSLALVCGNYSSVRTATLSSQSVIFSLPSTNFRYAGVNFQNAILTIKYSSQQFIADSSGNYWLPVASPIASFS